MAPSTEDSSNSNQTRQQVIALSEGLDIPKPILSPSQDFYFPDGSVIIIIESTSFRVHQSVLSRHSDVFASMFSIPQPDDAEMMDGCPVVRLTGDSVDDFIDVLRALYDTFHFDGLVPHSDLKDILHFISGILRISTKYNFKKLRAKCINIIERKFPSTLAGCDEVLSDGCQYVPGAIIQAIPLAKETTLPEILPWAYYLCTHIDRDELLADPVLSWKDKALCMAGKDKLWELQKKTTHQMLFEFRRSPQCINNCQPGSMGWRDIETWRVRPHPLEEYVSWSALKLCVKCLEQMESQHKAGREEVWNKLPGVFLLGTWESIKSDQGC